ncbi:MAG: helix-turn-helix transcriptional regulator [Clostridiales bacterium]|nr:helix-turn-helix transcriptional regulator [Clostridiales bacterium]
MAKGFCEREKEHTISMQRAKEGILSDTEARKVCKLFALLSDANRLKIVLALLNGDMCVYHLTEVCGGTQSAVSHQLRILRDNGIVKSKRLGQNVEYSIADTHISELVRTGVYHALVCDE